MPPLSGQVCSVHEKLDRLPGCTRHPLFPCGPHSGTGGNGWPRGWMLVGCGRLGPQVQRSTSSSSGSRSAGSGLFSRPLRALVADPEGVCISDSPVELDRQRGSTGQPLLTCRLELVRAAWLSGASVAAGRTWAGTQTRVFLWTVRARKRLQPVVGCNLSRCVALPRHIEGTRASEPLTSILQQGVALRRNRKEMDVGYPARFSPLDMVNIVIDRVIGDPSASEWALNLAKKSFMPALPSVRWWATPQQWILPTYPLL